MFDPNLYFQTIYWIKTVDFSGIRTQIVRVEGEHADHHHNHGPSVNTVFICKKNNQVCVHQGWFILQ